MQLLIIGFGDIGARVASLATSAGHFVTACGRRGRSAAPPLATGNAYRPIDLDQPASLADLHVDGATLLYLAPPPPEGRQDPRVRGLCAMLNKTGSTPARIVYASTSGVYGNCDGALIDESRPANPQTDRSCRRLDAEETFHAYAKQHKVPLVILRIAGIYGPGRLPLQRLAGMKVLSPEQAPLSNRVHADDLARVCLAACERGKDGAIFNVCDGEQSTMSDYFFTLARVFDLPEPQIIDREEAQRTLSAEMLSYLAESRRLDNRRLREELGVVLRYPTLESGLQAIRREGPHPDG